MTDLPQFRNWWPVAGHYKPNGSGGVVNVTKDRHGASVEHLIAELGARFRDLGRGDQGWDTQFTVGLGASTLYCDCRWLAVQSVRCRARPITAVRVATAPVVGRSGPSLKTLRDFACYCDVTFAAIVGQ